MQNYIDFLAENGYANIEKISNGTTFNFKAEKNGILYVVAFKDGKVISVVEATIKKEVEPVAQVEVEQPKIRKTRKNG